MLHDEILEHVPHPLGIDGGGQAFGERVADLLKGAPAVEHLQQLGQRPAQLVALGPWPLEEVRLARRAPVELQDARVRRQTEDRFATASTSPYGYRALRQRCCRLLSRGRHG